MGRGEGEADGVSVFPGKGGRLVLLDLGMDAGGRGGRRLGRARTLLLEEGASPDVLDSLGRSPLHLAVKFESIQIVILLLDHGASPNSTTFKGDTPLHFAVNSSIDILRQLASCGDLDAVNLDGDTPLHLAAMQSNYKSLTILIQQGASIDVRNDVCVLGGFEAECIRKAKRHWISMKT